VGSIRGRCGPATCRLGAVVRHNPSGPLRDYPARTRAVVALAIRSGPRNPSAARLGPSGSWASRSARVSMSWRNVLGLGATGPRAGATSATGEGWRGRPEPGRADSRSSHRRVTRRTSGRVNEAATTLLPTHPQPCRSKRSIVQSGVLKSSGLASSFVSVGVFGDNS
jgi:hypothetical protein